MARNRSRPSSSSVLFGNLLYCSHLVPCITITMSRHHTHTKKALVVVFTNVVRYRGFRGYLAVAKSKDFEEVKSTAECECGAVACLLACLLQHLLLPLVLKINGHLARANGHLSHEAGHRAGDCSRRS